MLQNTDHKLLRRTKSGRKENGIYADWTNDIKEMVTTLALTMIIVVNRSSNLIRERGLRCIIGFRLTVEDLVQLEKYALPSLVEAVMIFAEQFWCPVQIPVQTCRAFHHRYRSLQSRPGNQTPPSPSCIYVKGPWYSRNVFHRSPPSFTEPYQYAGHRSERHAWVALYKNIHTSHAWLVISYRLEEDHKHGSEGASHNDIEYQVT